VRLVVPCSQMSEGDTSRYAGRVTARICTGPVAAPAAVNGEGAPGCGLVARAVNEGLGGTGPDNNSRQLCRGGLGQHARLLAPEPHPHCLPHCCSCCCPQLMSAVLG